MEGEVGWGEPWALRHSVPFTPLHTQEIRAGGAVMNCVPQAAMLQP